MSHRNAPLTPEGRLRLVRRCIGQGRRPIAHVAAEASISRQCLSKWVRRYRQHGEAGLHDQSSAPQHHPTRIAPEVVEEIIRFRKTKRWSAVLIAQELHARGTPVSVATVTRYLRAHGLHRLRWLDPETGEPNRATPAQKINARYPGHMIHIDIKKVGQIPDGGGWRVHGKNSEQNRASHRARSKGTKIGYTYIHSATDGFSRVSYSESLNDEKAVTAIGFLFRARVFFQAHGIDRFTRIVTDNGSCYRAHAYTRAVTSFAVKHQRIKPYTPKHNGKVERYQQTMARELLYSRAWTSEQQRRDALATWVIHYNYHRSHTTAAGKPPVTRLKGRVTNVLTNNR